MEKNSRLQPLNRNELSTSDNMQRAPFGRGNADEHADPAAASRTASSVMMERLLALQTMRPSFSSWQSQLYDRPGLGLTSNLHQVRSQNHRLMNSAHNPMELALDKFLVSSLANSPTSVLEQIAAAIARQQGPQTPQDQEEKISTQESPSTQAKAGHTTSPQLDCLALVAEASKSLPVIACEQVQAKTLEKMVQKKGNSYMDYSKMSDEEIKSTILSAGPICPQTNRGGVSELFPDKLHRMLNEVEGLGLSDVVSFLPHGRAFLVHKKDRFVGEVMPKFFKHRKWESFSRQLSLYGFIRITRGQDMGAYCHELFLRGRPSLSAYMRRVGTPSKGTDRRKKTFLKQYHTEPDFSSMEPIKIEA